MRKVQSFSLDDIEDKEVLDHLIKLSQKGSKINKSAYIVNLIKEDLNKVKSNFTVEQIEEIKRIVMDVIREIPETSITLDQKEEFDSEVLNALDQFEFGGK